FGGRRFSDTRMPGEHRARAVFENREATPDLLATVARALVQAAAEARFDVARRGVVEKHRSRAQRPPFVKATEEQVERCSGRQRYRHSLSNRGERLRYFLRAAGLCAIGRCVVAIHSASGPRLASFAELAGLLYCGGLERTQHVLPESFQVIPQQRQAIEVDAVELLASTAL